MTSLGDKQNMPQNPQNPQGRSNLRIGLILGSVALALFIGSIVRYWLMGR